MGDWINKLHEQHLSVKADEHIAIEKRKVADENAIGWWRAVHKAVESDVERFKKLLQAEGRIIGPENDMYGMCHVRCNQFPVVRLDFRINGVVLEYRKSRQPSFDSPKSDLDAGVITLKGEVDGNVWMDWRGAKLLSVEDVSEALLKEVIEAAKP